ncbi:MAG TPA: aspartyl protease family protein [Blastocatellia bacterium]|nr:aspartyl protease family protein [Blastocatellia bacterium]
MAQSIALASRPEPRAKQIATIPIKLVKNHIFIRVEVNNSGPLWFLFDTGDKFAILNLERAKQLNVELQGKVRAMGGGPGALEGAMVKSASVTVAGLSGFSQPVVVAIPLGAIEAQMGHQIDGLIGADFISQYVVEIDYASTIMRLYEKDGYAYSGTGTSIPIHLNGSGHLLADAQLLIQGRSPIDATFVVDLGSNAFLSLHRPFVDSQHLVSPNQKTLRMVIGFGAGGESVGLLGRIAGLKIGGFTIDNPVTNFSQDEAGVFANASEIQGNIGAQIMEKFKVILDYGNNRMILEPNSHFADPMEADMSGLILVSEGTDYKTIRISQVTPSTPGAEAGLKPGDTIVSVDGDAQASLTLSSMEEMFSTPATHTLRVKRENEVFNVELKLRRLV